MNAQHGANCAPPGASGADRPDARRLPDRMIIAAVVGLLREERGEAKAGERRQADSSPLGGYAPACLVNKCAQPFRVYHLDRSITPPNKP